MHDVGDSLSPLVDLGQIEGGFVQGAGWLTLEDLRWDESDGERPRPAHDAVRVDLQAAVVLGDAERVQRSRCWSGPHEDGAVYGSKAVGEPPLMLAFSVREALRDACAAFGPPGRPRRARLAGHARGGLLGADRARSARGGGLMTTWFAAVAALRAAREAGVLVTVTDVRGHAPRDAGAKMVVSADADVGRRSAAATSRRRPYAARASWSSIQRRSRPSLYTANLSDKAPFQHGVQCCGAR